MSICARDTEGVNFQASVAESDGRVKLEMPHPPPSLRLLFQQMLKFKNDFAHRHSPDSIPSVGGVGIVSQMHQRQSQSAVEGQEQDEGLAGALVEDHPAGLPAEQRRGRRVHRGAQEGGAEEGGVPSCRPHSVGRASVDTVGSYRFWIRLYKRRR